MLNQTETTLCTLLGPRFADASQADRDRDSLPQHLKGTLSFCLPHVFNTSPGYLPTQLPTPTQLIIIESIGWM